MVILFIFYIGFDLCLSSKRFNNIGLYFPFVIVALLTDVMWGTFASYLILD